MPVREALPNHVAMDYSLNVGHVPQKRFTQIANEFQHAASIAQQALDNGHCDAVIEHTLPIVKDLETKLTALFSLRVVAWSRKGRFKEELQEALAIVSLAPHDPVGYLLVGRLYSDRGFQTCAIKMFNKGLKKVLKTDSHYKTLQQAKQYADQRRTRRFDILAQLPYDIACRIIDFVPLQTLIQCARLSTAWREFILEYPKPWRRMKIDLNISQKFLSSLYSVLPMVVHHLEHLSIPSLPCVTRKCLKQLSEKDKISRFRSLQLVTNKMFKQEDYSEICSTLNRVAETLTSLDVHFEGRHSIPSFSRILSICPRLKSIKYFAETTLPIISPMILNHTTQLTDLDLTTPSEIFSYPGTIQPITDVDLQNLIQRCPYLQNVSVTNCCVEIYESIRNYCPDIRTLRVNQSPKSNNWSRLINKGQHTSPKKSMLPKEGLKLLEASNCFPSSRKITPLLKNFYYSLEVLSIESPPPLIRQMANRIPRNQADWQGISTLPTLIHLVDLRLVSVPPSLCYHLPALLNQIPNLKTFCLKDTDTVVGDGALMVLANKMPNLSNLWLHNCQLNGTELQHMMTIFAHTSSLSLLSIGLLGCSDVDENVKITCAKIQSLRSLSIHLDDTSVAGIKAFAQDVARLPSIQRLSIHNTKMTVDDLWTISSSSSLSDVDLISIKGVTEEQVENVFFSNEIKVLFEPCT